VSNTPDGVYANSAVASSPTTLALSLSTAVYSFTFSYAAGNAGQWGKIRAYNGSTYSALNDASPFHFGGGTTLATLRQKLGKLTNDLVSGTTTSAGNTVTANCNQIDIYKNPTSYFVGQYFNSTALGEVTEVTAFVKAGGVFTLFPAITSVGSGVAFEVTQRWTPGEYREAINWAIAACYPRLSKSIVNTGFLSAEDIFSYAVPNDIKAVDKVEMESADRATYPDRLGQPWREVAFEPIKDGLQHTIEFKRQLPYVAATTTTTPVTLPVRRIRIRGTGMLSQLYNDSDSVEVLDPQVELIIFMAAQYLYARMPARAASTDREFYEKQAKFYMSMFENYKGTFSSGRPARRMWQQPARWGRGAR
jgi:hypothetical protein